MNAAKILIVDDNVSILNSLKFLLEEHYSYIDTISNPNLIPDQMRKGYDVVLLDMNFTAGQNSGNEGIFWLNEILKIDPAVVVIMITAYGSVELAVKAMREGAIDFIEKPWDNNMVLATMQSACELRRSRVEIDSLKQKQFHIHRDIDAQYNMVRGSSTAMKNVYDTIEKIADTNVNILLLGENGTGKEVIAREIHRQSNRSNEIFLSVDIGSLSETLFESELFGHAKGAFTDAKESRIGKFEAAKGGTLFLDEIGNLSVSLQAKLLAVLESRMLSPLGSNEKIPVDVRLICATNQNLQQMIAENLFREDLFYRINTIQLEVPPLREREDDIATLAQHFMEGFASKYNKTQLKFTTSTIDKIRKYAWPGNIRELKHTIEKTVILCNSVSLKPGDLHLSGQTGAITPEHKPRTMDAIEKQAIIDALEYNKGNLSATAEELDISRQTLYNKIKKYDI